VVFKSIKQSMKKLIKNYNRQQPVIDAIQTWLLWRILSFSGSPK